MCFLATSASSSSVHENERVLYFLLLQLIVIIGFARMAANVARMLGQPRVVGEIIGGLLLGPSLLGRFAPNLFDYVFKFAPAIPPRNMLSQLGLIMLMFQIGLDSIGLWGWCALLVAGATFGKYAGAYFAARWAGLSRAEAKCAGIMMNTRGLMELIILNVGYDLGVIPPNVFTMLVLMAIFSTIITAPFLRRWLPEMGYEIQAFGAEFEV